MAHWDRDSERDVDVVTGCYMFVRASAIQQVGLLDESFFFCGEETDWCRRFKQAGWKVRFAPVGEILHWGGASGQCLEFRRDMLLTEGLIRYHRKFNGFFGAATAYAMIWLFCAVRLGFWWAAALFRRSEAAARRCDHFVSIVRNFARVWPSTALRR